MKESGFSAESGAIPLDRELKIGRIKNTSTRDLIDWWYIRRGFSDIPDIQDIAADSGGEDDATLILSELRNRADLIPIVEAELARIRAEVRAKISLSPVVNVDALLDDQLKKIEALEDALHTKLHRTESEKLAA